MSKEMKTLSKGKESKTLSFSLDGKKTLQVKVTVEEFWGGEVNITTQLGGEKPTTRSTSVKNLKILEKC